MGTAEKPAEQQLLLGLLQNMLEDVAMLSPHLSKDNFKRDFETLQSRVAAEGIGFLTIALPRLGKALDEALESGRLTVPVGFSCKKDTHIPKLFQSLFSRVFADDGGLTVPGCAQSISTLRQLLYVAYKLELPYSPELEAECLQRFKEIENVHLAQEITFEKAETLLRARSLLGNLLDGFEPRSITPGHGPGAVATGERLENKWCFKRLFSKLHSAYPYYEYFVVGGALSLAAQKQWYMGLERLDTPKAKVILVPKDSRGPRIISEEPLELMYIQQGLMKALYEHIEFHWLTHDHVNFTDQTVNRDLAYEASRSGYYATVDMKDASDCVSLALVRLLFPESFVRYLEATRSTHTVLPSGEEIEMKKFAPMGSALCFPIEALVFWSLSVATIARSEGINSALSSVWVYGDDIVLPSAHLEEVRSVFKGCLLVVNERKTLSQGLFRESCGMDAYNGTNVTPTRVKKRWRPSPGNPETFESYTAIANELQLKGFDKASGYLYEKIEAAYGKLPYATSPSNFPCRLCDTLAEANSANKQLGFKMRVHREYQALQIRVKVPGYKTRATTLNGWSRLLRNSTVGCGELPDLVVLPRSTILRLRFANVPMDGVAT